MGQRLIFWPCCIEQAEWLGHGRPVPEAGAGQIGYGEENSVNSLERLEDARGHFSPMGRIEPQHVAVSP